MNSVDPRFRRPVSQDVIWFGPFRLSTTERLLEKGGEPVLLGSRALDILLALVERPAEVVSKKELIARVWPDLVVDEGSLRFHVSALRKALGQQRSDTRYVTNVSGRGYCFVAPISHAASKPAPLRNSLAQLPIGLPRSPVRMAGRDETVRLISEELTARRFFTIVGPSGIGKTTLATAVSGYDQRIRALFMLARSLWLQGYTSRAISIATQALHRANALDHPVSLCICWISTISVFLWTGDWPEADRIIDRLIACAEKYSLRPYHAIGLGMKGVLSLRRVDAQAGQSLLTACLDASEAGQHQSLTAVFISDSAIALARAGQVDEADAAIDRVMAWGEPTRSHFHLPEMMRIKGEIPASGPHLGEAENWFSRSLNLAREQSALAWELRRMFPALKARIEQQRGPRLRQSNRARPVKAQYQY